MIQTKTSIINSYPFIKGIQVSLTIIIMEIKIKLLDLLVDKEECIPEEDICVICKDLVISPIQCSKCSAICCLKCGQTLSMCPKKCGKDWDYEKIEPKQFQLKCPFSNDCEQALTPENFITHIMTSDHITPQVKKQYREQLGNRCQKQHPLTLMIDTFKSLTSQQCHECKQVGLARSQCKECNVIFCVICRPIQMKQTGCPEGHKLRHVIPKQNLPFLCDICGKKDKLPKEYYVDKTCNIGICSKCYDDMEQE